MAWIPNATEGTRIVRNLSSLSLALLVTYLANIEPCTQPKMTKKDLANGYSSDSTQRELSNEYQHGRVLKTFIISYTCVPLMKVASVSKG